MSTSKEFRLLKSGYSAYHSPISRVPGDLLIEVALFLESRKDTLNFCLTVRGSILRSRATIDLSIKSNYIFSHVSSVLYEKVVLKSAEQCTWTLGMLARRVDVARHVRELIISLSRALVSGIDNATASSAVRKVAEGMRLDALAKFCWDAEESPYHEDMWFALRMGCVFPSVSTSLPSLTGLLQVSSIALYRNVHRLSSP